jgi:pyrroloquinoline quinone (PQQ) biosynthesis protein C/mannose-6-phosphate isomerase-like protein (cupin superfamily)
MLSTAVQTASDMPPSTERRDSGTQLRYGSVESMLEELRARRDTHALWDNRLLQAFAAGTLDADDLRYVFAQYYLYARNFTRYLSALMTTCESDFFRARLSEALWSEGGGHEPELRHAHIFRRFLARALGVTGLASIAYDDATRLFVDRYLRYCLDAAPLASAAFLSLGTEGIVPRLYSIFVEGLRKAGIDEAEIALFRVHIDGEGEEAAILEQLMTSYAHEPGWREASLAAMETALTLRDRFFDGLFEGIRARRMRKTLDAIQARASLAPPDAAGLHHRGGRPPLTLYTNHAERLNVDFVVERIPVDAQVLDPRIVRIPAGKSNERHRHAHETFMYVLRGRGLVLIDDAVLRIAPGDGVLVPRWSLHQTQNMGDDELVFLAVTDFHLAEKAFVGDARAYRDRAHSLR